MVSTQLTTRLTTRMHALAGTTEQLPGRSTMPEEVSLYAECL
jgi:hypothetical protein